MEVLARSESVWTADPSAPDMGFYWERVNGEYVIKGSVRDIYMPPYYTSGHPWPHCGSCDERLRRCGVKARCGRQHVASVNASHHDISPCEICQKTGRIWCSACCAKDDQALALAEVQRIFVSREVLLLQTMMRNNDGWCYFVQGAGTNMIKIGTSLEPENRLRDLQNSSPIPLRTLGIFQGGRTMEKHVHWTLRGSRAHGEWFHDSQELRDIIRDMRVADERIDDHQKILDLIPRLRNGVWEDICR